ncbi:MAG TPA: glycosyltransferase family A protein [Candidatus Binataceae bacterium]|nr:glycosyltransferase family A protein [Candidatus Binataceae bacterium]
MSAPEVSVIIPSYNRREMLCEAIGSVLAQSAVNFELIVVDDGSTDGTGERLEELAQRLDSGARRRLRTLRIDRSGPAAARNTGVGVASAPLLAFLDSDDLWKPRKLERQLALMRRNPQCAVSQTEEIWLRKGVRVNPAVRNRKRAGDIFIDSLRTCLISPSAAIIRADVFRAAGGFDEDMTAAEDYDLWLRVLAHYQAELLPEPLVVRRAGHPGQLSATVPALDRFRILALLKLLARGDLDRERRSAVGSTMVEKCIVYGKGLARRGRAADAKFVAELAAMAESTWCLPSDRSLDQAIDRMRSLLRRTGEGVAGGPPFAAEALA